MLVTAAHQYPTGGVLPPERRAALVDWADRRSGWVIEDDYDAEFRYDREPIGALQGLRAGAGRLRGLGEQDARAGAAARLARSRRPSLVDGLADAKLAADHGSPAHRPARARRLHRAAASSTATCAGCARSTARRRDALLAALARHLPELRPVGASAGLHVLAWLPPGDDEAAILAAADAAGIGMSGIKSRWITGDGRQGLVFGYGADPRGADRGGRRAPRRGDRGRPRRPPPIGLAEPPSAAATSRVTPLDPVGIGRAGLRVAHIAHLQMLR